MNLDDSLDTVMWLQKWIWGSPLASNNRIYIAAEFLKLCWMSQWFDRALLKVFNFPSFYVFVFSMLHFSPLFLWRGIKLWLKTEILIWCFIVALSPFSSAGKYNQNLFFQRKNWMILWTQLSLWVKNAEFHGLMKEWENPYMKLNILPRKILGKKLQRLKVWKSQKKFFIPPTLPKNEWENLSIPALHGSYRWTILFEKCGRPDLIVFHLKRMILI